MVCNSNVKKVMKLELKFTEACANMLFTMGSFQKFLEESFFRNTNGGVLPEFQTAFFQKQS